MKTFREYITLLEGSFGQMYDPAQTTQDRSGFMTTIFNSQKGPVKQFVLPDEKVDEFMQGGDVHSFEQKVKQYFKPHAVRISWGPFGRWAILAGEGGGGVPDPITVRQPPGTNPVKASYNRVHPAQSSADHN